jgi:hypothetical protein
MYLACNKICILLTILKLKMYSADINTLDLTTPAQDFLQKSQ